MVLGDFPGISPVEMSAGAVASNTRVPVQDFGHWEGQPQSGLLDSIRKLLAWTQGEVDPESRIDIAVPQDYFEQDFTQTGRMVSGQRALNWACRLATCATTSIVFDRQSQEPLAGSIVSATHRKFDLQFWAAALPKEMDGAIVRPLVASWAYRSPLLRKILGGIGSVPINRDDAASGKLSLQRFAEQTSAHQVGLIFAGGEMIDAEASDPHKAKRLEKIKPGVALAALTASASVFPVGTAGIVRSERKLTRFRGPVVFAMGAPLAPPEAEKIDTLNERKMLVDLSRGYMKGELQPAMQEQLDRAYELYASKLRGRLALPRLIRPLFVNRSRTEAWLREFNEFKEQIGHAVRRQGK